jgi:hypothetical protein
VRNRDAEYIPSFWLALLLGADLGLVVLSGASQGIRGPQIRVRGRTGSGEILPTEYSIQ